MMNPTLTPQIQQALASERLIDITTTGRVTGQQHRIEIFFHNIDGRLYITGKPGKRRQWYENLRVNPSLTFHLKQSVTADLPAQATPILDEAERRRVLAAILAGMPDHDGELEAWVAGSPLVQVDIIGMQ
ncbi:MAG: nitroreductase family deazaflavin-dependent oxidoreductase [Anaerolineaceae bacterium]|nr:nitroreductase family deazaflavin-dependent oxidoreductase [Anaerolineaceae bacterium]